MKKKWSKYALSQEDIPQFIMDNYMCRRHIPVALSGFPNDLWITIDDSDTNELYAKMTQEVKETYEAMFDENSDDEILQKMRKIVNFFTQGVETNDEGVLEMIESFYDDYALVKVGDRLLRASILSWTGGGFCSVFYIDEGFYDEDVFATSLLPMCQNLKKYPTFAIKCYLYDDGNHSAEWNEHEITLWERFFKKPVNVTAFFYPADEKGYPVTLRVASNPINILGQIFHYDESDDGYNDDPPDTGSQAISALDNLQSEYASHPKKVYVPYHHEIINSDETADKDLSSCLENLLSESVPRLKKVNVLNHEKINSDELADKDFQAISCLDYLQSEYASPPKKFNVPNHSEEINSHIQPTSLDMKKDSAHHAPAISSLAALQEDYASDEDYCSSSENENLDEWNPQDMHYYAATNNYEIDIDDPSVTLYGYANKEEDEICQFYGKTGTCFKGDSCRKLHIKIDPEKFSNIPQPIYTRTMRELEPLEEGESYDVFGLCMNTGSLIIQLQTDVEMYGEMFSKMNDPMISRNFKRLTIPPGVGEIVLVRFGEEWHRGQCLKSDPDADKYKIRVVDQGPLIEVDLFDLRVVPRAFIQIPFLGRVVRLKDLKISTDEDVDSRFFKWLGGHHENQFYVVCVGSGAYDYVELYEKNGDKNLHSSFLNEGFAQEFSSIIPSSHAMIIPG